MSFYSDYKVGAIDKEEFRQCCAMENRMDRMDREHEEHQINVIPDSYLPMDCDGKFREQDCEYCIEYEECKERWNDGRQT